MPVLRRPDGCRLYYEVHGDSSLGPLVLLEGAGGDIPGWGRTVQDLAARCRVVAFDFRGNGRSDPLGGRVWVGMFVEDTLALMDAVGADRAHVYGQSFGGMVAQELALTAPHRVRSLILAATHCGRRHRIRTTAKVPKDRPYEMLYSEAFVRDHADRVEEHQRLAERSPQPPDSGTRQWEAMLAFDACDRLERLEMPVLVMHGAEDRLIPPENAKMLAERIPGSRLVLLEGAGHVYHWEQPDEAIGPVLSFVDEVEAGRSR
jgi:pimeloyl-ACP methyl ester carboxylesterase